MASRCAILFAAMCALVPAAAAQPDIEATSLEATGPTTGQGTLEAMLRVGLMPPDSTFQLQARHLHLEVDVADPVINAGARPSINPTTEPSDHEGAHVTGTAVREGFRWLVLPSDGERPTVTLSTGCLKAMTDEPVVGPWSPKAKYARGSLEPEIGDTAAAKACNGQLTLRGDFTLVLWEWDALLKANGETRDLWSGARPSSKDPVGTPESGEVFQEFREIYFYATDAVLQVPLDGQDILYLRDAGLGVEGSMLLKHATGVLRLGAQVVEVQEEDVYVRGDLNVELTASATRLGLNVKGDVDEVKVNGEVVSLQAAQPVGGSFGIVWLIVGAVVAGVLAVAARVGSVHHTYTAALKYGVHVWSKRPRGFRERVGMGWHVRAHAAWGDDDHPRARRLASRAIRWAPRVVDHRWLRALAARDQSCRVALQDHAALDGLLVSHRDRAHNALKAAEVCRKMGDGKGAQRWSEVARQACPEMVEGVASSGRSLGAVQVHRNDAPRAV